MNSEVIITVITAILLLVLAIRFGFLELILIILSEIFTGDSKSDDGDGFGGGSSGGGGSSSHW